MLCLLLLAAILPFQNDSAQGLELVRLDSDVYAAIRRDPLSLAVNSNSLIVVRDSDVVVVDAQFTRTATEETIAAIRRITRTPVAYVINTHWHDDHVAGDQVYRDSFPGVRFVMQENTAADLVTLGAPNSKAAGRGRAAGRRPVGAALVRRARAGQHSGAADGALGAGERDSDRPAVCEGSARLQPRSSDRHGAPADDAGLGPRPHRVDLVRRGEHPRRSGGVSARPRDRGQRRSGGSCGAVR